MKIYREKAGVISEGPAWVCIDLCWMYTADTLWFLLWTLVTEWRHDRHLCG